MSDNLKLICKLLFIIFVFFTFTNSAYALVINQIAPVKVAHNTMVTLRPTADVSGSRWVKIAGPDWISISPKSGLISGTTPNVSEAHYVGVKAVSGEQVDKMIFILIVGNQTVYRMDGVGRNPSTLSESKNIMSGGDVLIIPDGSYSGEENSFNGSASVLIDSGSATAYTTWIAENPGHATIPSMESKGAEYVAYKGLHFVPSATRTGVTISGESKGGVSSNNIKVIMCSTRDGGFQAISGARNILFEDVYAYGDSRAIFRVGSTGTPSQNIIFRRAVGRHDYSTSSNPTAMFMQYGGENVLYQNCIAIDQSENAANFSSAYDHYGAWETKNGSNIFIKDSIAINIVEEFHFGDTNTDNTNILNSVFWDIGTGSTSWSANTTYDNLTIGDVNAQNTNNTYDDRSASSTVLFTDSIFHDIEGTGTESGYRSKRILYEVDESSHNLFNPIQPDITIGDTTDIITNIDPVDGVPGNGVAGILYPIRIENGSDSDEMGLGANVIYRRGVSGTIWGEPGYDDLLDVPLWPWPFEDEINIKMASADVSSGSINVTGARGFAVPGETLTNYIWSYLGNVPPPFNVQAFPFNSEVDIYWDPPVDLENVTGFRVYDVTGESKPLIPGIKTPLTTVSGNSTFSITIDGLSNGTTYDFVVTTVDSVKGEGSYSYRVSATPVPVSIDYPLSGFYINLAVRDSFIVEGNGGPANSDINIYINGTTLLGSTTVDSVRSWSISLDLVNLSIDEGAVSITAESGPYTSIPISGSYDVTSPLVPSGVNVSEAL